MNWNKRLPGVLAHYSNLSRLTKIMICKTLPEQRSMSEADIQACTDGSHPRDRVDQVRQYLPEQPGELQRIFFYLRLNTHICNTFLRSGADARATHWHAGAYRLDRARYALGAGRRCTYAGTYARGRRATLIQDGRR